MSVSQGKKKKGSYSHNHIYLFTEAVCLKEKCIQSKLWVFNEDKYNNSSGLDHCP